MIATYIVTHQTTAVSISNDKKFESMDNREVLQAVYIHASMATAGVQAPKVMRDMGSAKYVSIGVTRC